MTRKHLSCRPQLEALDDRCLPSFGSPITTAVYQPTAFAAADLNGDGKLDLITVSNAVGLQVRLGKGNGHFAAPTSYTAGGASSTAVTVGDFNGDGKLDIVTGNDPGDGGAFGMPASISVLLGNGNGSFSYARIDTNLPSSSSPPTSLAVGDFNADGKLDLASTSQYGDRAVVLLGNGNGTFAAAQIYGMCVSVTAGDFNGDGKVDLGTANGPYNTVSVLLNNGTGTFGAAQNYAVGAYAGAVAVGDFNGDGKLDLVTLSGAGTSFSVLPGDGAGAFGAARTYAVGGSANSVAVGDFNRDGKLDIVAAGSQSTYVLLGNGTGTFGTYQNVGPAGSAVVVGDFNGDGFPDLAQFDGQHTGIDVLLNKADWQGNGHK